MIRMMTLGLILSSRKLFSRSGSISLLYIYIYVIIHFYLKTSLTIHALKIIYLFNTELISANISKYIFKPDFK